MNLSDKRTPLIMGCFSITDNSFYDGGLYLNTSVALNHAYNLIKQGADILDIGAESTKPGSKSVSVQTQLKRILPVVQELKQNTNIPISIDTRDANVMQACLDIGVDMINDVNALQGEGCLDVVAKYDCDVCLMHMQGTPFDMQNDPSYTNPTAQILEFLGDRKNICINAGINESRLYIDPGFGFGKSLEHNLEILGQLSELKQLGLPILAGLSRKSMLGQITGKPVEDRQASSVAAAILAAMQGADILRVHDVSATLDAMMVVRAIQPYWLKSRSENADV
jgi:dihydropteroate synthase